MKTDSKKIFTDRPYFLQGFVVLVLVYEYDTYPCRIEMLCEHPDYQGFDKFWLTVPLDDFEKILPFLGDLGRKSYESLVTQLKDEQEQCKVNPYEEFGEYLVCVELIFKAAVSTIEDTFVDFQLEGIAIKNEPELLESKHRAIKDIAMDIYNLAMKHGYEYQSMFDYLFAMMELETIYDSYGDDNASYILKAFLGNIQYWRIDAVKPLRKELKELIGTH